MTRRLEVLKASLQKKQDHFDAKLANHFASVKEANGQPLNDKRNGRAALSKWDAQNDTLRSLQDGIALTTRAIEREELRIAAVEAVELPEPIKKAVKEGVLIQWRKHPNCFFVPGVNKGRIVWNEKDRVLAHRYLREVPPDQYAKFRDTYNGLRTSLISTVKDSLTVATGDAP